MTLGGGEGTIQPIAGSPHSQAHADFSSVSLETFSAAHDSRLAALTEPPASGTTRPSPIFVSIPAPSLFLLNSQIIHKILFFSQLHPPLPSAHSVGKEFPSARMVVCEKF